MKASELRGKNEKELMGLLKSAQEDIEKSVSDVLLGKSKDTSQTKKFRRQVARLKVILAEKKIIAAEGKNAKENI